MANSSEFAELSSDIAPKTNGTQRPPDATIVFEGVAVGLIGPFGREIKFKKTVLPIGKLKRNR